MTRGYLRTDPGQRPGPTSNLPLDWYVGDRRSTVQCRPEFFEGLSPSTPTRDLLRLAVAAYCTDRLGSRTDTADGWTRDLGLSIPIAERAAWAAASRPLTEALDFLSGDHWSVDLHEDAAEAEIATRLDDEDAVCLFSGGLDSLCGAIDLLEAGNRILLVSHYEGGIAPGRQTALYEQLRTHYGRDRVTMRQLFLRPAPPNRHQHRPLPRARENTMRARSLLFVAAGLAVASSVGERVPLYIPENGYIGINVPLTGSRPGSLSTRTTHPYFFHRLQAVLEAVGVTNELRNPFRLATKGEMLAESRNPTLLRELAPTSVSCSHPETARYDRRPQGNCGYCYPCLIRRAALNALDADTTEYAYGIARDADLLLGASRKGASLRALIRSLAGSASSLDVLRNGHIPNGEAGAFGELYLRGREELRAWLIATGGPKIVARLITER